MIRFSRLRQITRKYNHYSTTTITTTTSSTTIIANYYEKRRIGRLINFHLPSSTTKKIISFDQQNTFHRYFSTNVNNNNNNINDENIDDENNSDETNYQSILKSPALQHFSVVRAALQARPTSSTSSITPVVDDDNAAAVGAALSLLDVAMLSWLRDRDTAKADRFFVQALREPIDETSAVLAKSQYAMYICEVDEAIDDASELVLDTLEELDSVVGSRARAIVHWNAATFFHRSFEDWDAATEQYRSLCSLLPHDADALCAAATMYISRGAGRSDYETALEQLNGILRHHPNHVMTLGWTAFIQENYFRNFARAQELYEQAIKLAPRNAYINRLYGLFLAEKLGDVVRAEPFRNFIAVGTLRRRRLQPHEEDQQRRK